MTRDAEFKVVKLFDLDDIGEQDFTRLVINGGKDKGVKEGDKFVIYSLGDEVIDPDTGESLGKIEIIKGKGRVIHAQEKMSTIESTEKKKKGRRRIYSNGGNNGLFGGLINFPREEIVDDGDEYVIPFNNPEIGDIAKRII